MIRGIHMFFKFNLRLVTIMFFGIVVLFDPAYASDEDVVKAKPALWQVKKDEGTVYLLGSFHLLPKNYLWYNGIIQQSFDSSEELVMETKMTPESTAAIQAMVMKNAFLAPDDSLKNHLDSAHYEKLLVHSKKLLGMDETAVKKLKPWFVALQLSVISIMSTGMDLELGVDKHLEALAGQKEKSISGLESAQQAMNAMINHPLPVQTAMLNDTFDQLDDFKSYINSYLSAWASGDAAILSKTMIEEMAVHTELYQALIIDRNNNWMPAIEQHINSGKTIFIVVGAAHLVGQDGIVRMLRDKGYQAEKIQ